MNMTNNHRALSALPNTAALFATTMALTNEEDDFDGGMVKATGSASRPQEI